MAYEYKEETLIKHFMPWFTKTRNYIEKFEDTDTSGSDPVDSAGFIDNKIILIEFKHSISPKEVRYIGSAGSSIEKKIRTVLNNLYHDQDDRVTRSLKGKDLVHEPHFILVVNRLSDDVLEHGTYKLNFNISVYQGVDAFYPFAEICFRRSDDRHHHIPLLLTPFGYSTYRGS